MTATQRARATPSTMRSCTRKNYNTMTIRKLMLGTMAALAMGRATHAGMWDNYPFHDDEQFHTQGMNACLQSRGRADHEQKCDFPAGSWTRCMQDHFACGTAADYAEFLAEAKADVTLTVEEAHSDVDTAIALGKHISGHGDGVVLATGGALGDGVEILVSDAAAAPHLLATYCNLPYHLYSHYWKLRVHVNDHLVASCTIR